KTGDSLTLFYIYTIGLGVSFSLVSFVRLSIKRVAGNYRAQIMCQTKVEGFEKLLNFSLGWHYSEAAGAKTQRIQNGVDSFKTFTKRFNNEIMRSATALIGMTAVFIFLRPTYLLFFAVYVIVVYGIIRYFYRRIQRENDGYYASTEQAGGTYVEGLSNILTIKTLGAHSSFTDHVTEKEERTRTHEYAIISFTNNQWKSFQALNGLCYGGFLLLVGSDIVSGTITAGAFVIFYGYLHNLILNMGDILDVYDEILNAKSGIGRMMSILWSKPPISVGKKKFPKEWGVLTLSDVSFAYRRGEGNSVDTVSHVDLTISRNAHIGVVGKTGSGKSTVAKLLAGLFPISSGKYLIGNTSFYDLSREEQNRHMTLVLQETEVFNFSLRDNITLMRRVDEKTLRNALRIAQLDEVVAKLPDGVDTIVGEKGYHLSGGERQRVGIARALCRDAEILIFDEATSSLDTKTEKNIQCALESSLSGKTIIMIAHRISTLEHADRIYVFDEGRIVEFGTFKELFDNKKSRFSELYVHEKERS
ncbi:MAG: ABC transporter ATP-binding protein, partial [bacterium]|nr:ABC transporter ATP-binding protein [bacterium]